VENLPVILPDSRLVGLVLLVSVLLSVPSVTALTEDEVRAELMRAYESVATAEEAGGYVIDMVSLLDEIARNLPNAAPDQLENYKTIINFILVKAAATEVSGRQSNINELYEIALVVLIIAVLGLLTWSKGSSWFWATWLRAHHGWRIERT
jgi:hypothetical protein